MDRKKQKQKLNSVRTLARLLVFTEHRAEVQGTGGVHIVGDESPPPSSDNSGHDPSNNRKSNSWRSTCGDAEDVDPPVVV